MFWRWLTTEWLGSSLYSIAVQKIVQPKGRDGASGLGGTMRMPQQRLGESRELVAGRNPLFQATSVKQKIPKAESVLLHGNESATRGFFSFLPVDDGPYSKGGKDAGGTDVALACRRQSIPGNEPPSLSWRHGELRVSVRWHWLCCYLAL